MTREVLDNSKLLTLAPAIFAEQPSSKMSSRYQFLKTIDVVDVLRGQGIVPVQAAQRRTKSEQGKSTTKHMVRFSLSALVHETEGEKLDIVMINSHDGMSTYRFALGVFRLVCTNGLVVCDKDLGELHLRHVGLEFRDEVIKIANQFIANAVNVYGLIDRMRSKQLEFDQRLALATQAALLRWPVGVIQPSQLLDVRREDDKGTDLWTVMNVIQENLVRAGFNAPSMANQQKVRRVREIKAIDANYNANKGLWEMAQAAL